MKKKLYTTPSIHVAKIRAPRILAGSETIPMASDEPITDTNDDINDIGAKGTNMGFWDFDE